MEGHGKHGAIGRKFGIGIIGLGEGKGLVKGLHGHPELPVHAVCDTDEALSRRIARRFNVASADTDLAAMLVRREIDIVVIYTPDQLHLAHIRACFAAGKHVICTKPLVTSLDEARELIDLTQQYPQCKLMVGQSSRFFGPMQHQRRAFENGDLGELNFVEAHYVHDMRWFYGNRPWAMEGGFDLLFACCSHPVDLVRWYLGDVQEVSAYAHRSKTAAEAGFAGNDTFIINLKFIDGRISRVFGLYGLEQPHQYRPWIEVAVYGTQGTFIAGYPQLQALVKYKDQAERLEAYFEDIYHFFQYEGVNHHAGEFVNYTEHFARAIHTGEDAQPDALDGFKTMATLEAIRASIDSGRPEVVESLDKKG